MVLSGSDGLHSVEDTQSVRDSFEIRVNELGRGICLRL